MTFSNIIPGITAWFNYKLLLCMFSGEVLGDLTLQRLIDEASRSNTNIEEIKKDVIEPSSTDTGSDSGTGTGTNTGTISDKPNSAKESPKTENKTTTAPVPGKAQPQVQSKGGGDVGQNASPFSGVLFIVIVAACSVAGLVGLIMAGVCWFNRPSCKWVQIIRERSMPRGIAKDRLVEPAGSLTVNLSNYPCKM
ncbi:hypothetical protein LOTGIDRAFT_162198 [Lottia gigantea]|uniref:Ig-like domain-containing protein n=1 Tax=Lottia gigantea TaxID=225164 RepID=V4BUH3_LOTGI|nr:hypothetical protein LOTGIDRAFT_162198 [Lottia gigantea]ESO92724.1 hypothetical protein LOTGIDRAFT_162198 [Lottia gigantea]